MLRVSSVIVACGVILCTAVAAQQSPQEKPKSPEKAAGLSLLGTLVPVGAGLAIMSAGDTENGGGAAGLGATCVLGGVLVGPGLGHSYAGNGDRLLVGLGLRALGLAGATTAVALSWDNPDSGAAALGFGAGMLLVVVSAIYDIATADDAAVNYNKRHGLSGLSVSPTYFANQKACGLSFTLMLP